MSSQKQMLLLLALEFSASPTRILQRVPDTRLSYLKDMLVRQARRSVTSG